MHEAEELRKDEPVGESASLFERAARSRVEADAPPVTEPQAEVQELATEEPVAERRPKTKPEAAEPDVPPAQAARQGQDDEAIIAERLANFERLKAEFEAIREELLGAETTAEKLNRTLPKGIVKLASGLVNFTRLAADAVLALRSLEQQGNLKQAAVEAKVMDRKTDFLAAGEFRNLLRISGNQHALRELLTREVYREIPCERILMLKGISQEQLQALVVEMGYNPRAFFSDQRGENAGRIAIDNHLFEGKHPFAEELAGEIPEEEMAYWQPVFPEAKRGPWKNWRKSRTHSVVYAVKDGEGKDVLLLPVHVDPKNAVAVIVEAFRGKRKGEKSALAYHRTASGNDPEYVGTGLYDLGIAYFLKLLSRQKDKGGIAELRIEGADKLQTRFSITGDDAVTWQTEAAVKAGLEGKQ